MSEKLKPYICGDHPEAQIKKSWDQNHAVLNGYPAGTGWGSNYKYECNECGRELCSEEEHNRRAD